MKYLTTQCMASWKDQGINTMINFHINNWFIWRMMKPPNVKINYQKDKIPHGFIWNLTWFYCHMRRIAISCHQGEHVWVRYTCTPAHRLKTGGNFLFVCLFAGLFCCKFSRRLIVEKKIRPLKIKLSLERRVKNLYKLTPKKIHLSPVENREMCQS